MNYEAFIKGEESVTKKKKKTSEDKPRKKQNSKKICILNLNYIY